MNYCVCIGRNAGLHIIDANYCICIGTNNDVPDPFKDGQINIYGLQFTNIIIARILHFILHRSILWMVQYKWGVKLIKFIGNVA